MIGTVGVAAGRSKANRVMLVHGRWGVRWRFSNLGGSTASCPPIDALRSITSRSQPLPGAPVRALTA